MTVLRPLFVDEFRCLEWSRPARRRGKEFLLIMKCASMIPVVAAALLTFAAATLPGCGGGGGGGADLVDAIVMSISIQGVAAPIYTNGQPPQAAPPAGVFLNARIAVDFGDAIDASTLPPDGPANGSIRITAGIGGAPATGSWSVDPIDPSIAYFNPFPPTSPSAGCTAGLNSATTYVVDIPDGQGGTQQIIRFSDGTPIQAPAQALFQTTNCSLADPSQSFTDAVAGSPTVVSTTPTSSSAAPTATQGSVMGNPGQSILIVNFSEPLQPSSVTNASFRIVNLTANGTTPIQVVGILRFDQTGSYAGSGSQSRVVFTTNSPIADGDMFEFQFNGIVDLGNNPISVPAGPLRFTIQNNNDDVDVFFTEDFTTTTNLAMQTGAINWGGSGKVLATFPQEFVGTGTDGVGNITTAMNINTNTNMGLFNFTQLTIGTGSSPLTLTYTSAVNDPATATSNWAVQLRSQSTTTLNQQVTLLCNGRTGTAGTQNSALVPKLGGWGGPGGGAGGTASPSTSTTNPDLFGLPGEGGHTDLNNVNLPGGTINTNIASSLFGGGGGGNSGPATTLGPSGGGGGTASNIMALRGLPGETQQGTNAMGAGAPAAGAGGPPPSAMIPPLQFAVGGSGGGAGGDRLDTGAVANHDTGGAGGGGGGAIRISAGQDITIGQVVALNCTGGNGGSSQNPLTAKGGGGSGGSITLATFTNVNLALGVQFLCGGGLPSGGSPTPGNPPDGDGGAGGQGVIQLQDADGTYANIGSALVIGELFQGLFPFTGNVTGTATSIIMDTTSTSPNFVASNGLGATGAVLSNGATGMAAVMVVGIAEDPDNIGNPGTTMALMSPPTPISNITAISGYRYFRFECSTSFPAPPATTLSQALPEIDTVSIAYRR